MYAQELQFIFYVCQKFYELTNIRHSITSAHHPQANDEVERSNRTTQEAFLKTQEFHNRVAQENTDWTKKLQGILFVYRIHKQASTHFSPFYMMYGREPLLPWQMKNDLGHLDMSQEVPQVSIEDAIEKMENLCQQVLEVAAGNIQFRVMLIPYFMLTLKMTREFLVNHVVFRFLGIQVVVMKQLK